jgi:hypothetical protein
MWSRNKNTSVQSEWFQGLNIFDVMSDSIYGKIQNIFTNGLLSLKSLEEYNLPKVIVIGNESAGKSSLLENITKCEIFPKSGKLCTKCPIHIKMSNGENSYSITYRKKKTIVDKNNIFTHVKEIMDNLRDDDIDTDEILINIKEIDGLTFEFYDLPGIRAYPPNIAKISIDICKKYMKDKNSIVLCVVPATTTRLTSCQSIALITEMQMEQRCILALTMPDRLQPENYEELLVKRILGTSDELEGLNFHGRVAIVNRLHTNQINLQDNDNLEREWFVTNILNDIPEEYLPHEKKIAKSLTILNLLKQMTKLYNEFINAEWKPSILENIEEKISNEMNEYSKLGEIVDSENISKFNKYLSSELYETIIGNINDRSITTNFISSIPSNITTIPKIGKNDLDDEQIIYNQKMKYYIKYLCLNYPKYILNIINSNIDIIFSNSNEFKLKRFDKLKELVKNCKQQYYDLLYPAETEQLSNILLNELLINSPIFNSSNGNVEILDIQKITKKFHRSYVANVLFPLVYDVEENNFVDKYTVEDYEENEIYKNQRIIYIDNIKRLKEDYEQIKNL